MLKKPTKKTASQMASKKRARKKSSDLVSKNEKKKKKPTTKKVLETAEQMKEKKEESIYKKFNINAKQELFCQLYATDREFFGNGTQAYIEAYDIDLTKKGAYETARVTASQNLTKPNILKRIDNLLELDTLNITSVDKKLAFWIEQSAEPNVSLGAIKEFNKLKGRIVDKLEVAKKGYWDEVDDEELKKQIKR